MGGDREGVLDIQPTIRKQKPVKAAWSRTITIHEPNTDLGISWGSRLWGQATPGGETVMMSEEADRGDGGRVGSSQSREEEKAGKDLDTESQHVTSESSGCQP